MRGTVIIIRTSEPTVETKYIDGPPDLAPIKDGLEGGYLELVPGFTQFSYEGETRRCVAFVDEDGIRKGLPYNLMATALWRAQRHPLDTNPFDTVNDDHIKGNMVVVFGDDEWMAEL